LNKVCFSCDREESGGVLFSARIVASLRDFEEFGIVDAIFIGGIGPVGDGVLLGCDMGGAGHLTGWLTHALGTGVVLAVGVMTEARVLEGVFAFGRVNVRLG